MVRKDCSGHASVGMAAIIGSIAAFIDSAALAQREPLSAGAILVDASLLERLRQSTDVQGARSRLEQAGLQFTFSYYSDAFANPVGGLLRGFGYDGRFGAIVDADLEKLVGWTGTSVHASLHQIHGTQFSARNLNNLMTTSGIEAPPSTRLFNLWVEQRIGSLINLRVGQFTAAQEFLVSQNANLFVNATFGWPASTAQNLPSGGPAYPEATPGARIQFSPNKHLAFKAAIFNGDPAGPGIENPVQRDPFGVAFRVNDPPLFMTELTYLYGQEHPNAMRENTDQEGSRRAASHLQSSATGLPGAIKIGAIVHTGFFADQRLDAQGSSLALSRGRPLQHRGN
jgi:porin